jgi:hypothetical protein
MAAETISHGLLKELATAGAIRRASAVAIGDRWGLMVSYGGVERTLAAANSHQIRSWANLNTLVKYVMGFGIRKLDLDATNSDPSQKTLRRPDKSAALKKAHQAAAYDKWFKEQVKEGIDEADSPDAQWFTTDQVFAEIDKDLEELTGGRPNLASQ